MKRLILIFNLIVLINSTYSQTASEYFNLSNTVSRADKNDNELLLKQSKQLLEWSKKSYVVKRGGKDTTITVKPFTALVGCALYYVRVGKIDSMYHYFQEAIDQGFDDKLVFIDDYEDYYPIYNSAQTIKMKKKMHENYLSSFKVVKERNIADQVINMFESDQYIRHHYEYCKQMLKVDSVKLERIKTLWEEIDRQNQNAIIKILEDYGYPGKSLMGDARGEYAFFIIQHFRDVEKQKEYYPMLKVAVEKGELDPMLFMMIEDRINVKEGKEQKHGTQTFIIQ